MMGPLSEVPANASLLISSSPSRQERSTMKKDRKQLKINIKGQFKNVVSSWLMNWKLRRLGVNIHDIKHMPNEIEVLASGQKQDLWQVVNWSKRSNVFFYMNEDIFEFADPA